MLRVSQVRVERVIKLASSILAIVALEALSGGVVVAQAQKQIHVSQSHSSPPSSSSFQSLAGRANAARDADRLDEAIPLYRKALALRPRWSEGWWSLGTIFYDRDEYAPAASAFQKVIALDPKQGTAMAMRGLCEFELGHDDNALRNIEASKSVGILEDPQLRQVVLFREGVLLQRAGRFEGAQKALSSLCLSGVKSEELAHTFGMVALRMRDREPPAAGTPGAEIVEHMGRGACLAAQKSYDTARQEFDLVIAKYPNHPFVHFAYGRMLIDAKDRASAIREFQQEITEAPDSVLARLQVAAAEYKVDSAAGLPYAQEAVRLAPQQPLANYMLGLLLLDLGDYQKAIPQLEIARKAFPQEAKIDWSLAAAYAHASRPQDAAQARATFVRLNQAASKASANDSRDLSPDAAPHLEINEKMEAAPRH